MSNNINNYQETAGEKQTANVVLNLETLKARYNTILLQYQQASADYTNYLKQTSKNTSSRDFTTIQGNAYWGTGPLANNTNQNNINSVSKCEAICQKNSSCSGATYTSNANGSPACFLRSGEGQVVPAAANDSAIVPLGLYYLNTLQNLNAQLAETNNQILIIIKNKGQPLYSQQVSEREIQTSDLEKNYNHLISEREKIEGIIQDYQDLDEAQNNGELVITQNYYTYILLIFVAILCVYILIKISASASQSSNTSGFQQGGSLSKKTYYIVFAMLLASILIYNFFNRK